MIAMGIGGGVRAIETGEYSNSRLHGVCIV